jgi:DNA (cytosine-5)-methyltransferase 1
VGMTVGSLFAGIGGFDLAAERAGITVKWQVEIDPFCRKVLEKHWPHVKRYGDIKRVRYPAPVDIICGGFPCQDISLAGKGAGIAGKRSVLWKQMLRIIRAVRPRYVVVENVSALLGRGMADVLGGLASSGFDAEWDCIPASAVGANHQRDRVWVVAYPNRQRELQPQGLKRNQRRRAGDCGQAVAHAGGDGLEGAIQARDGERSGARIFTRRAFAGGSLASGAEQWRTEPDVGRVAHGVPARVDRLRGLGNAIVPQVAEWIFRRIIEADGEAQSVGSTPPEDQSRQIIRGGA